MPFALQDCRLSFPARSAGTAGKSDGAARALPGGPGCPMTLHYGKAIITLCSSASSLITQGPPAGQGWGMVVSPAALLSCRWGLPGRKGTRGQGGSRLLRRDSNGPRSLLRVACLELPRHRGRRPKSALIEDPARGREGPAGSPSSLLPACSLFLFLPASVGYRADTGLWGRRSP